MCRRHLSFALLLSLFAAPALAGCMAGTEEAPDDLAADALDAFGGEEIGTSVSALSIDELQPTITSFNPLRIEFPGVFLKAVLEREILAALDAQRVDERETKFNPEEVHVDLGHGEITVKIKGNGRARKCTKVLGRHHCTAWISSTVRAQVTIGLSVNNWVAEAQHRHTDVSASNDAVDALIRTFRGAVYPPINSGIKRALSSIDGRNLRAELEAKLGIPLPANAVLSAFVSPAGLVIEAKDAPPAVERVTYLGAGEVMNPGDSVRSASGNVRLVFQGDGNLVLYCASKPVSLWASGTVRAVDIAAMQGDGNFVLYAPGGVPVWHTGTDGHPGTVLAVQDDGNVVLYAPGRAVWSAESYKRIGLCN